MSGGDRLVRLLQNLGCPDMEAWTGSDVDWLLENPACANFVEELCMALEDHGSHWVLSEAELNAWDQLQSTQTSDNLIWDEELLDQALQSLEQSEQADRSENLTVDQLRDDIDRLSEELGLLNAGLDQIGRVSHIQAVDQTQRRNRLAQLSGGVIENANGRYLRQQESIFDLNGRHNSSLDQLVLAGQDLFQLLLDFRPQGRKFEEKRLSMFVSEANMEELIEEERAYTQLLREFHSAQFSTDDDELKLLRESTGTERNQSLKELTRLKMAYAGSERERVLNLAKLSGINAAEQFVNKMLGKFEHITSNMESFDVGNLLRASREMEGKIKSLQTDINALGHVKLNSLAERRARGESDAIYLLTLQNQSVSLLDSRERLQRILDFALSQRARQCVIGILCDEEVTRLENLVKSLNNTKDHLLYRTGARMVAENRGLTSLKQFEEEKTRSVVHASDELLRGLLDITVGPGFGSKAFITNFDAISAINAVSSKLDNVTESLEKHGKSMKDAQSELKKVISSLKELLHLGEIRHVAFEIPAGVVIFTRAFLTFQNIAKLYKRRVKIMIATFETVGLSEGIIDDAHVLFYLNFGFLLDTGKQVMLSCPEVCLKVNELQSGLKDFEVLVRDAISQWNRESKSVKQDPHLYMQRQLWVDLINKPKVLRANVEAMTKKAA